MLPTKGNSQILVLDANPSDPQKGTEAMLQLGNNHGQTLIPTLSVMVTRREPTKDTEDMIVYLAGRVTTEDIDKLDPLLEGGRPAGTIYFVMKYNTKTCMSDSIRFGVENPINMTTPEMEAITI